MNAMHDNSDRMGTPSAPATMIRGSSLLWTPDQGASGMLVIARHKPLLAVIGGRLVATHTDDIEPNNGSNDFRGRRQTVTLGGLVIVSNSRQKEPTRVIGHPDLASGASVQRGETLYVSVAEAIYRESRGEDVELHLAPTDEDKEALSDLRARARHRWDSDRLPDGWTRPLPANPMPVPSKQAPLEGVGSSALSDDLRALAERIRAKEEMEEERERDGSRKRVGIVPTV